jgi:hypothetical protein
MVGRCGVIELQAPDSSGLIQLTHGINVIRFDLAGHSVGSARLSLGGILNVERRTCAYFGKERLPDHYVLRPGDQIEFMPDRGRKGSGDERDEYFLRSKDSQLKLNEILVRLRRIEEQLVQSNKLQAPSKEFYSVEDFAELVDLAPYTVREHCRLGRLNAQKAAFGRGGVQEWRIPHAELVRYRNFGLLPLRKN